MLGLDDGQFPTAVPSLEQSVASITQERDEDFAVRREVVNDQNARHADSQVLRFQRSVGCE
jgi:hypothetical protein